MTVYLCSGTVIDSSSVAISAFSTFGANAGNFGYQNLSDNFSVATSLPEGNYFLSVMVDSANAVAGNRAIDTAVYAA